MKILISYPSFDVRVSLLLRLLFPPSPGVISFVVILIVVVIILVSVVSLRFKCNHSKDSEGICLGESEFH